MQTVLQATGPHKEHRHLHAYHQIVRTIDAVTPADGIAIAKQLFDERRSKLACADVDEHITGRPLSTQYKISYLVADEIELNKRVDLTQQVILGNHRPQDHHL